MSKLTTEARSAILSARAKNRKAALALQTGGVEVPKAIAAHMKAVEEWANKALEVVKPAKADKPAKATKKVTKKAKAKAAPEAETEVKKAA